VPGNNRHGALGPAAAASRTTEQSLGSNRMNKAGYRGTHHLWS
jgi:hypothetical protein